jgi:hypothetical protein
MKGKRKQSSFSFILFRKVTNVLYSIFFRKNALWRRNELLRQKVKEGEMVFFCLLRY